MLLDEKGSSCVNAAAKHRGTINESGIENDPRYSRCSSVAKSTIRTYKRRKFSKKSLPDSGGADRRNLVKDHDKLITEESDACVEEGRCTSSLQIKLKPKGAHDIAQRNVDSVSNANPDETHCRSITKMCWPVFFNIITSETFATLCKLLAENFHGRKLESILSLNHIKIRLKDGTYEDSPVHFCEDIQQVWRTIRDNANELVSCANGLSELSTTFFSEQLRRSMECKYQDEKHHELRETAGHAPQDEKPVLGCCCNKCGEKASQSDSLICNSCEKMYHISCIISCQPKPKKEIHRGAWHCAVCTASGVVSPHQNFLLCERLKMTQTVDICGGMTNPSGKRYRCKICGWNVEIDQPFKACDRFGCSNKYYHLRCLPDEQLKSCGSMWYCPSCLCRVCLTDGDEDKIVLCDGCDHGYHIYCMNPPQTCVTKNKWFCRLCQPQIREMRRVKRALQKTETYFF